MIVPVFAAVGAAIFVAASRRIVAKFFARIARAIIRYAPWGP